MNSFTFEFSKASKGKVIRRCAKIEDFNGAQHSIMAFCLFGYCFASWMVPYKDKKGKS